jgi:3-keto-5-aminohexanoate cleavage enzyme
MEATSKYVHAKHEEFVSRWPIHLEPQNTTMKKKLIVGLAPAGTHISRNQNPNQPYFPDEIAREVSECFKAGVSMWHLHVRDKNGFPTVQPERMKETIDLVRSKCPDIITSAHVDHDNTKSDRKMQEEVLSALIKLKSYPDTVVIHTASKSTRKVTEEGLQDQVKYIQENGLRPELQCQNFIGPENVKRWLIKPGILEKPYFINYHLGKHETVPLSFSDPYNYFATITMMQSIKEPDGIYGVYAGGRNWLPVTVFAIMVGADVIRPGMEDTIWLYPHRDEVVKKNIELIDKVVTIAQKLGRDIATPKEARQILGIK